MAKLNLSLACWDYDRTRPLIDGRINPKALNSTSRSCARARRFRACWRSVSSCFGTFSRVLCHAQRPRKLPIRGDPGGALKTLSPLLHLYPPDSGIHEPKDLRSKRVGTTQLGSTGVVFLNGMLQNEYGVTIRDIDWFIGGLNTRTQ